MRCKKCKAKLTRKDGQYCPHCGTPVPKRRIWPFVVAALAAVALVAGVAAWWFLAGPGAAGDGTAADDSSATTDSAATTAAATTETTSDTSDEAAALAAEIAELEAQIQALEEYEYDETVVDTVTASTSASNLTVAAMAAGLEERGFTVDDCTITVSYTQDGSYLGETEVDATANASETYPIYTVYWYASDTELWTIYVVNGSYMAFPIFEDYDYTAVQTVLVEDAYVTSYDASADEFIMSLPGESELLYKQVEAITAELLASINSYEEVDAL